ncbi:hypothetical protein THAOC_00310, partial [Thalassiosira oceanica]
LLSSNMKLQLLSLAVVALIQQSASVASHEGPSFSGVSLLDDAKDAAAVSIHFLGDCQRLVLGVPLSPLAIKLSFSGRSRKARRGC